MSAAKPPLECDEATALFVCVSAISGLPEREQLRVVASLKTYLSSCSATALNLAVISELADAYDVMEKAGIPTPRQNNTGIFRVTGVSHRGAPTAAVVAAPPTRRAE